MSSRLAPAAAQAGAKVMVWIMVVVSLPGWMARAPARRKKPGRGLLVCKRRVQRTSGAGTGASMEAGLPSTQWMAFLGHLVTQVPQPLHLV